MNTLLHWWRLLVEPSGKGRLRGFGPRRWKVDYTDGGKSVPMGYDEACDYAKMFGGNVVRHYGDGGSR